MKKLGFILLSLSLMIGLLPANQGKTSGVFSDVEADYWAYDMIVTLADEGVIKGYEDQTFKPHRDVTRGQAAMLIGRAMDIDTSNRPDPGFSDVNKETSGYEYIAALTDEGVFVKADKFNPGASLKRDQMAKVLVETFELTGLSNQQFDDVPETHWAHDYISTLLANEVTTGKTPERFDPVGSVNRTQMAVFLYRVLGMDGYESEPSGDDSNIVDEAMTKAVLDGINAERNAAGLKPLSTDQSVQKVANLKAFDMMENNYFDHYSPTYGSVFHMLDNEGVTRVAAGENIAAGQQSAKAVVEAWMNSQGHKDNILHQSYTHVGVGYAEGGEYGSYYVLVFIGK
ncbi:S-layer homology domain-containing protein [Jeotgalibacillus malaysiensis]|uniref:S-layer homology domain-containing protein n=1 Tax=Jeotgalibacillus malaysiensis TaxID=1508404 RepID=UPI00384AE835